MYKAFLIAAGAVSLLALSCWQLSGKAYEINKTSPDGVYRVKIKAHIGPPTGTRDHTEYAKIEFFKGQEVIYAYKWVQADRYEPSFQDGYPIIEWIDNNVLRMGRDRSNQPFFDELVVLNNTDEHIKYCGVVYGRYESFKVFDLPPKAQVTLQASPGLGARGAKPEYSLGYGGMTESGKEFHGALEGKQRGSFSEGPVTLQIVITEKDFKSDQSGK